MHSISVSRMESFLECPLKYDLEYNQKIKCEEGEALRFGSFMHKILEMHVKNLRNTGQSKDPKYINDNMDWVWDNYKISDPEQKFRAREMLSYFMARDIDTSKIVDIELLKGPPFPRIQGAQLWCRFDRVDAPDDKSLTVVDYKTGRFMPDESELASSMAYAAYSWGMRQLYPGRENYRMEWLYLDASKKISIEAMDCGRAEDMIEPVARRMLEATEYPPTRNHNCKYCGYPKMGHCAIGPKPRVAKKEATDGTAPVPAPADNKADS